MDWIVVIPGFAVGAIVGLTCVFNAAWLAPTAVQTCLTAARQGD